MEIRHCFGLKVNTKWVIIYLAVSVSLYFFVACFWRSKFTRTKADIWNAPRDERLFPAVGYSSSFSDLNVSDPENNTFGKPKLASGAARIEAPSEEEPEGRHSKGGGELERVESGEIWAKQKMNGNEEIPRVGVEHVETAVQSSSEEQSWEKTKGISDKMIQEKEVASCDVTKGKWVYDESYPLYSPKCSFIDEGLDCYGNGRLDTSYMKWRWQPDDCDIPRFNASRMLELIKGKRMVFVGDSLNRNQWESMLCLLMGAVKDRKKVVGKYTRKFMKLQKTCKLAFPDYQCSVEFRVTHFLVQEGKARLKKKRVESLRIDKIDGGSAGWRNADILIFNTGHWWSHSKTNDGINYFQEGDKLYPHLNVKEAFSRALTTWATWVDKNMNPKTTKIFFRNFEPSHFGGGQWNSGGRCSKFTQPLKESSTQINDKNAITEGIIRKMRTPVTILNITGMTDLRIDGHPSRYSAISQNGTSKREDCSHWCLPGVPDTWNELLYYFLLQQNGQIVQ